MTREAGEPVATYAPYVVPAPDARTVGQRRWLAASLTALVLSAAACATADDDASADTSADASAGADAPIELRDQIGPHVDAPDRAMAMTVDAIDVVGDDILVRVRVSNSDDRYLDLGVQDTIYGPLLLMRDDREHLYESYAVEPAGIPGHRIAHLSFRLAGPLDPGATTFTLELATQRGPLIAPDATLPSGDAVRWRVDDPADGTPTSSDTVRDESEPVYAAAPRLPDLIHFWLETEPLPADR